MAKLERKVAYVVFRGRKPGIYYDWKTCNEQVSRFSGANFNGYTHIADAEQAWADWKHNTLLERASVAATETHSLPGGQGLHSPENRDGHDGGTYTDLDHCRMARKREFAHEDVPAGLRAQQVASYPKLLDSIPIHGCVIDLVGDPNLKVQPRLSLDKPFEDVDLCRILESDISRSPKRRKYDVPDPVPVPVDHQPDDVDQDSRQQFLARVREREIGMRSNRRHHGADSDWLEDSGEESERQISATTQSKKVDLTPEQEKVVKMALRGENIFLTGAAGSGKTTVLKEIIQTLKRRKRNVQVIAPTGIAALPLNGKTTYSFAGWNPDSLRKPMIELLKTKTTKRVIKAINNLDVLIVEEISMVENQFLERLNMLLQYVVGIPAQSEPGEKAPLPFGGKQVIFLGDFHQLPPVLPFQFCLHCGEPITRKDRPLCESTVCEKMPDVRFSWGDKWAFRAPIWRALELRHVKLEQIHRQKDSRFQDILNKIRNGVALDNFEWAELERPKQLPRAAFAVRLMSRLAQVKSFNETELKNLKSINPRTWVALDACKPLLKLEEGESLSQEQIEKMKEFRDSLRDHRFPTELTLKVGARVVLLHNLSHEDGLVNGSQGTVVGFQPSDKIKALEMELKGDDAEWRRGQIVAFQEHKVDQIDWRPLVKFADGTTRLIPAIAAASIRGGSKVYDQYMACRTQIPLALAWALSIHKSQGMTLQYVEVSSRDIFESGQLYVALSRATDLNGLSVTGFNRKQLPMDKDVLDFYEATDWEDLDGKGKPPKRVFRKPRI